MAASFPVTFPSAVSTTSTTTLSDAQHNNNLHVKDRDEIIAVQTKVGLGTANATASGTTVLLGTGGTQSAWGQITNDYVSGTANISVSKLAALTASTSATIGSANPSTTSSSYGSMANMVGTLVTTGGTILAWMDVSLSNNLDATTSTIALRLDSNAEVAEKAANLSASRVTVVSTHARFTGVSAGTHTIEGRWKCAGGTLTAFSTQRGLTILELKG